MPLCLTRKEGERILLTCTAEDIDKLRGGFTIELVLRRHAGQIKVILDGPAEIRITRADAKPEEQT